MCPYFRAPSWSCSTHNVTWAGNESSSQADTRFRQWQLSQIRFDREGRLMSFDRWPVHNEQESLSCFTRRTDTRRLMQALLLISKRACDLGQTLYVCVYGRRRVCGSRRHKSSPLFTALSLVYTTFSFVFCPNYPISK
jgi:hypothetical protein